MNYFEQELRRLAKACDGIISPTFAGRACYGDLGGDNRVKLLFVTMGYADHYEALKATVLNRLDGEVDTLVFRFKDIWGRKAVSNPNFSDGIIPYIWTGGNKSEWYVYRPTDADFKLLAENVGAYLAVFKDRSLIPEKARGSACEKESVVRKIRGTKQNPAPRKDAPARKKQVPEL
jgi:hypothetical protein